MQTKDKYFSGRKFYNVYKFEFAQEQQKESLDQSSIYNIIIIWS